MPKLSVIVPAYNAEATIAEAIGSILASTLDDLELIVVDDGSEDGTRELAEGYAVHDGRIRVAGQAHAGVSAARNLGMDLAQGEYLAFVDADDLVAPSHFESLYGFAAPDRLDWVASGQLCLRRSEDGYLSEGESYAFPENLSLRGASARDAASRAVFRAPEPGGHLAQVILGLYRREFVLALSIRFREEFAYGEDLLFNLEVACALESFGFVREPGCIYRLRPEGASRSIGISGRVDKLEELLGEVKAICDSRGLDLSREMASFLFIHIVRMIDEALPLGPDARNELLARLHSAWGREALGFIFASIGFDSAPAEGAGRALVPFMKMGNFEAVWRLRRLRAILRG